MSHKHLTLALISLAFILTGAFRPAANNPELENFAAHLIGKFSSKKQSEVDTAYYHISLHMTRIWDERTDGIWLYVEQAMAARADKPYRQRVYQLGQKDKNLFTSEIYTIKNAAAVVGLQSDTAKRSLLTFDQIELKNGCTVWMEYDKGVFTGGTRGEDCFSDLRGARYATTKIKLTDTVLESWDQGFDATGKQVWGPTTGAYVFVKE
jgi:CpeT protein